MCKTNRSGKKTDFAGSTRFEGVHTNKMPGKAESDDALLRRELQALRKTQARQKILPLRCRQAAKASWTTRLIAVWVSSVVVRVSFLGTSLLTFGRPRTGLF